MKLRQDSLYSWIQAISAFLFHAVFFGIAFSFGIFYVALLQEFPGQESEVAWITGINFAFTVMVCPLAIKLLDHVSTRVMCCTGTLLGSLGLFLSSKATTLWVLYLTFGVMHGIGTNICYMSAVWVVRKNFLKHRDAALGLASAGSGAGGVIFGIFLPLIIESHGWRGAMQLLSYITFAFVIVSMVMAPVEQECQKDGKLAEKKSLLSVKQNLKKKIRFSVPSAWRNHAFVVLSVAILLCAFVSMIPYCHIVNYALQQGVRRSEADRLPLFISTGSLIGRIVIGKISGFQMVSRITLYQIIFFSQCLATSLSTLASNTASLIIFSFVFGLFDGAFSCLLVIVVDDVFFDKIQAMKAIGQLLRLLSIPYIFGAPLAGWMYTKTGSYRIPFLICGAILFLAAVLISFVRCLLKSMPHTPAISLPEKIVISPADKNSEDLVPAVQRNSSPFINSRACSLIDLAVDVYAESHFISSTHLAVVQRHSPRGLEARNEKHCNIRSQDFLKAEDSATTCRVEVGTEYTDLTNQISGMTSDASFSTNPNKGSSCQVDIQNISVSSKQNEDFCPKKDRTDLDGDVSDSGLMDYGDNDVLKRRTSGISVDDAGYFSSAPPATYKDNDTQSVVSRNGLSINTESNEGSLESFSETDLIIENEQGTDFKMVDNLKTSRIVYEHMG